MRRSFVLLLAVLLAVGGCSCAWGDVPIDAEHFPDEVFREHVKKYDTDRNNVLSDAEIALVISIDVNGGYFSFEELGSIASLRGIEYFTDLEKLWCNRNQLTALDVSNNTALTVLDCDHNQLTALDVKNNKALEALSCMFNQLMELDLSNNTALTDLNCECNRLTALDASNNTALTHLYCGNNRLTTLDISNNTALEWLHCFSNDLTALDIIDKTALRNLTCWGNRLTALDASNNTALTDLNCAYNRLTTLDISKCKDLELLDCCSNDLTTLDVSNKAALEYLWCYSNDLNLLDVGKCTALVQLVCYSNALTTLDVSECTALRVLECYSNDISELHLNNNKELSYLNCGNNRISALDLTNKPDLRNVACARNQISELDVTSNLELAALYCYNNRIRQLDLSHNPQLETLSCTNNLLGELDISNNPRLSELDCGGNYLADLNVSHNPKLKELYFSGTTLRSVDVSLNTALISLDCISTDITTIDLSANLSLDAVGCYGNSRLEALYVISTDNSVYPYKTDLREYVGTTYTRITGVKAYDKHNTPITASFAQGQPEVLFAQLPNYIIYDYSTGYTGKAAASDVPRSMSVRMSLPTHSFTYLPKIEAKVVSVDSKVVSVDEAINFHASRSHNNSDSNEQDNTGSETGGIYKRPDTSEEFYVAPENEPDHQEEQEQPSGSSGGGCDSGFGIFAMAGVLIFAAAGRKRTGILLITIALIGLLCPAVDAQEQVNASDYTLPTDYRLYDIAGTYSTNFTLTQAQRETIANFAGIDAGKVHTFAEAALQGNWKLLPQDFYNLAKSGEYGGVVLPVVRNAGVKDKYVIMCTFSNDIQPDELLTVHGFEVDPSTMEAVYSEGKDYLAEFITMDNEFARVERVPANRKVYLAVSFTPQYVNTGILGVVRGRYVEEDDPLDRLDDDVAQRIADDLGIDPSELKYLTRANIGRPVPPTEAMKKYVSDDNHEIIANLPTISVDEAGRYVVPVTISGDVWEMLKGKNIEDYKTYALNDSDLGEGQLQPAFINGLLGLWEFYTLKGEKMRTFGVKDFFLVGFLDAGKPFSLYIGQIIARAVVALLTGGLGGCSSFTIGGIAAAGLVLFKLIRRR